MFCTGSHLLYIYSYYAIVCCLYKTLLASVSHLHSAASLVTAEVHKSALVQDPLES